MKQKRKVKSLLPQKKDWRSSLLTAVLLILSVALCIGSASLITSTVRAAEPGVIESFHYTGLDEKQEVLYGMRFVDRDSMAISVDDIYIKGKSLYITSNPVVVNPMVIGGDIIDISNNEVSDGIYGHVLGGTSNKVRSQYVTIIAGEGNEVTNQNDSATLLGGESNNDFGGGLGTPMVVVGGSDNSIGSNHDGVALIGGKGNRIGNNVSNSFILGGEGNRIEDGRTNVIVGGKNVTVDEDDVFVYSNATSFNPDTSNAFYLNVDGGVGINDMQGSERGLSVKGAVNLGSLDINTELCNTSNDDNLGVEGNYQDCIVGCTKASQAQGKWEMLDRGEKCQTICRDNDKCIYSEDNIIPEPDYNSFCTEGIVDTSNAELCFPDSLHEYENAVFESVLVDNGDCPDPEDENKCVYQCKEGYHLAKDVTNSTYLGNDKKKTKCFEDCNLATLLQDPVTHASDWFNEDGEPIIIKHNETVTAYNKDVVPCSYDKYGTTNPTNYSNAWGLYLDNGYGTKRHNRGGLGLENGNKNRYRLPEHCGNNAHKQVLICVNGEMYIRKNNGEADTTKAIRQGTLGDSYLGYAHKGYIYKDCDTADYRCDISNGEYSLSKTDITKSFTAGGLDDSGNGRNDKLDRDQFSLTRGKYKLCLDYNRVEGNNETCDALDKLNPHEVHYKFMGCNTPYYTEYPAGSKHCMQSCSVTLNGGTYTNIPHGQSKDFYKSNEETCLDRCEWATFTCNDGKWIQSGTNQVRNETSPYQYYSCIQQDKLCDRNYYNVSQQERDTWDRTSLYEESCDEYDGKQRNICDFTLTVYRLTGCKPGYHTENGKWCIDNVKDEACASKPSNSHWVRQSGPINTYPWSDVITRYKTNLNEGRYLEWWNESCAWNDPVGCWTDELQSSNAGKVLPGNACKWACDTGFIINGDQCDHIDTTCKYPNGCDYVGEPYGCVDSNATVSNKRLDGGAWKWDCVNGLTSETQSCLWCNKGYHIENGRCVANVDGKCDDANFACESGLKHGRDGIYEWYDGTQVALGYTYQCLGIDGPNGSANESYMCPEAENVDCQYCVFGKNPDGTCKEPLCGDGTNPNESSDGIIVGKGWYPTTSWSPKVWTYTDFGSYNSSQDYCQWTCDDEEGYDRNGRGCRLRNYTITYNGNGGTPDRASDTVEHGDSVYLPGAERECHDFDGWNGTMGEGYYYGPVKSNVTLTAQWTANSYKIKYDCGNGVVLTQTETYGTQATLKSSGCSKQDYKLIGWGSSLGATTVTWQLGAVIGEDLINSCNGKTVYAVYRKIENGECYEEIPYGCMDDSNTVDKVDTTSDTEWKWYCVGADSTSPLCTKSCPSGEKLVWTSPHNGTCVAEIGENECDFKNGNCKYNEYNGETLYSVNGQSTYEKSWLCYTPGVTQPKACTLQWECEGNCVSNGNNCGDGTMYQSILSTLNTKNRCEAAGAYGKNQINFNVVGPCSLSIGINLGGTYSSIADCENLRFDPLSEGSCRNSPYCWYHRCFKFTGATKTCYTKVNGNLENKYTGSDAVNNCGVQPNDPWCTNSNTYTLSFNKNGCSSTNQTTRYLDAGTRLSFLSTEADCGSNTFISWNDKSDCSGEDWTAGDTMPSRNLTLYACSQQPTMTCGTVRRNWRDVGGTIVYYDNYETSDACDGGNFVGEPLLSRGVTLGRDEDCGSLKVKRKCSNGTSTINCSRNAKYVFLNASYNVNGGTLGSITVEQLPFSCFGGSQPCASARSMKLRVTLTDGASCDIYVSPTDQRSMTYSLEPGFSGTNGGRVGCPEATSASRVRKVEVVGEETYGTLSLMYDDYEAAITAPYQGGNASCLGEAVTIYGS